MLPKKATQEKDMENHDATMIRFPCPFFNMHVRRDTRFRCFIFLLCRPLASLFNNASLLQVSFHPF